MILTTNRLFTLSKLGSFATGSILLIIALCAQQVQAKDQSAQAMEAYKSGNWQEAESHLLRVIAKEPNNYRAEYYVALIHLHQNKLSLARHEFQLIIDRFPNADESRLAASSITAIDNLVAAKSTKIPAPTKEISTTAITATKPNNGPEQDLDYERAQEQAKQIRKSAAEHAQFFKDKAKENADDMSSVLMGRRFPSRRYSDSDIENANADLKQQAQKIIEAGDREADEVLREAEARKKSSK
ncbi:MAG TPA: tetratricopeptide repeat protein [Drouetiella sp.]